MKKWIRYLIYPVENENVCIMKTITVSSPGDEMVAIRIEEYIETIYDIVEKRGFVKVVDIVNELCLSPSTVSEMLKRLDNEGFINYEKYRGATLTKKGLKLAKDLRRKHKVLREFLITIGISYENADKEACKIEHVVVDETIHRLTKYIEFIKAHEPPVWIERFKKFYEDGEFIECNCDPDSGIEDDGKVAGIHQ